MGRPRHSPQIVLPSPAGTSRSPAEEKLHVSPRHMADIAPHEPLGAVYQDEGRCSFNVWAPTCSSVSVCFTEPVRCEIPLRPNLDGYHSALLRDVYPGAKYYYWLGDKPRPDPASRFQPETVHGPSEVVD